MFTEMTIDQIINGAPELSFPGLLPLVQDYLRNIEVDTDTMCTLSRYWNYVQKKASGKLMTNARFIRKYILGHPEYRKDSLVSESVTYDLLDHFNHLESGELSLCEILKA